MLDVAQLRTFVSTELPDESLQLLLDAAYEAIYDAVGLVSLYDGAKTVLLEPQQGDLLGLPNRASSIIAVTEGTTELEPADYRLWPTGGILERLGSGPHPAPRWCERTEVRFVPVLDGAEHDRVAIALVQLDLNHNPGITLEQIGSWSEQRSQQPAAYQLERAAILGSLSVTGYIA